MNKKFLDSVLHPMMNLVVAIFSISCVFPIVWLVYSSLKTQAEFSVNIISLPSHPQFANYLYVIQKYKIMGYFWNSLFSTVLSVAFIILLGVVIGYVLARFSFRGRNLLYVFFISGMLIPVQSFLIPLFIQFKSFHMLDNRFTLIPPYVAFGLPVAIFLFESYIKTIPVEMDEAACIDGCSVGRTMTRVIFPLCRPVLATVIILSFLASWNEFSFAMVLTKSEALKTLPVGLANFAGVYKVDYTKLMAALVISILPVIITYLLFYKKIIEGMTAGAVKG